MLHRIRVEGIEAYCSDLIVDEETGEYAYFLSVAGYQTAIKGILANFLKGLPLAATIGKDPLVREIARPLSHENQENALPILPWNGNCPNDRFPKWGRTTQRIPLNH